MLAMLMYYKINSKEGKILLIKKFIIYSFFKRKRSYYFNATLFYLHYQISIIRERKSLRVWLYSKYTYYII